MFLLQNKSYCSDLLHEGSVYRHLFPLQSSTIPLYLGNTGLERSYYYEGGTMFYHMLITKKFRSALAGVRPAEPGYELTPERKG
jgi:hypothetical protein